MVPLSACDTVNQCVFCRGSSNCMVELCFTRRQATSRIRSTDERTKRVFNELLTNPCLDFRVLACEECYQRSFKHGKYTIQAPPKERLFEPPSEIIPGKLYLGSCYSATNYDWLLERNVNKIIVCAPNLPLWFQGENNLQYLRVPIEDCGDAKIVHHLTTCFAFINSNGSTLVHCRAGVSRSASIVIDGE